MDVRGAVDSGSGDFSQLVSVIVSGVLQLVFPLLLLVYSDWLAGWVFPEVRTAEFSLSIDFTRRMVVGILLFGAVWSILSGLPESVYFFYEWGSYGRHLSEMMVSSIRISLGIILLLVLGPVSETVTRWAKQKQVPLHQFVADRSWLAVLIVLIIFLFFLLFNTLFADSVPTIVG